MVVVIAALRVDALGRTGQIEFDRHGRWSLAGDRAGERPDGGGWGVAHGPRL